MILERIGVIDIGQYSEGNVEAEALLGMGYMFALRLQKGTLPDVWSILIIKVN